MTGKHQLLIGDVRERLAELRPGSVQTCITSPPYWGLRSYATGAAKHLEIGSEPTPEAFVATMVAVFRLVRQALRPDGTLWLNLGDSYSDGTTGRDDTSRTNLDGYPRTLPGLAAKRRTGVGGNQLLMPHRVAAALQADGWVLRSTIIWAKRSPMPESLSGWRWEKCRVKVASQWSPCPGCPKCERTGGLVLRKGQWRPTTAHEYLFLLSRGGDYYGDAAAVAEPAAGESPGNIRHKGADAYAAGDSKLRTKAGLAAMVAADTRNPRSVWLLSHEPYREAHFATFPSELVRRCLLATTAEQCCSACGICYAPHLLRERIATRDGKTAVPVGDSGANRDPLRHIQRTRVLGYLPSCDCAAPPGRCVVLDPFVGSGTTLQTAVWYGRDAIGCELSTEYAALADARIAQPPRCLATRKSKRQPAPRVAEADQYPLFAE